MKLSRGERHLFCIDGSRRLPGVGGHLEPILTLPRCQGSLPWWAMPGRWGGSRGLGQHTPHLHPWTTVLHILLHAALLDFSGQHNSAFRALSLSASRVMTITQSCGWDGLDPLPQCP